MSDDKKDGSGKIIFKWWRTHLGNRDTSSAARALAARLNRSQGPLEVLAEPALHALARALDLRDAVRYADRLVRIAQVLAGVREHVPARLAQRLGAGEPPPMSTLRFQRLMRADDDDLATALRRALPMVDRACNVAALGADLYFWGEKTRTAWCFDYFGAPAPNSSQFEKSNQFEEEDA